MKLKNCTMGKPVRTKKDAGIQYYGHIIGFSLTSTGEVITVIKIADTTLEGRTLGIHPGNIEKLK